MPTQREIERSIVERAVQRGMKPDQIRDAILKFRETYAQPSQQEQQPSYGQDVMNDLQSSGEGIIESVKKRGEQYKDIAQKSFNREINPIETGARAVGATIGLAGDLFGGGLMASAKAVLPQGAEDYLAEKGRAFMETGAGKAVTSAISMYEKWKAENPRIAADVEAAANIASLFPAKKLLEAGEGVVRGAAGAAKSAVTGIAEGTGKAYAVTRQATRTAGDVATVLTEKGKEAGRFLASTPERLDVAAKSAREAAETLSTETPVVKKAVQSGFSPREAVIVSKADDATKKVMRDMAERAKAVTRGETAKSPADVAGAQLQKRLAEADALREEAGKALGEAVRGIKGATVPSRLKILERLKAIPGLKDVFIDNAGNLNFSKTALSTAATRSDREAINSMWRAVKNRDAYRLHQLRQEIFEVLGGRQKAKVPLTATQERGLEAIRQGLADAIEEVSPAYKALNRRYASIAEPMKGLRKFYRGLENAADDILDERSGILLRRLTSNSPSAQNLKQAIADIDAALAAAGKKSGVDLQRLQDFQNILEREYADVIKDTGFAGQARLGVKTGLGGLIEKGAEAVGRVAGNTPEYRRKVLDDLLMEPPKVVKPKNEPGFLYHGTDARNVEGIVKRGLLPSKSFSGKTGVFFADKLEDASQFFDKPVLLRIKQRPGIEPVLGNRWGGEAVGEFLSKNKVPVDELEIFVDGKWVSLEGFQPTKAKFGQPKVTDPSKFERASGLSPENKAIEDAAFAKVVADEDGLLEEYVRKAKPGEEKIVNADEFRPLFKDVGYAGHNAASVQEPSSYLAKRQFTKLLSENGSSPYAVYSAGGSGAGKSSALANVPSYSKMKDKAAVILDSNMSSYSSAKKKLSEAAAAGKKNHVFYVYRDPEDAFINGVVKRMRENPKEMGRLVPTKVVADNHVGSWDVIRALEDEGIKVTYVDNSLGFGKAREVTRKQLEAKIKYGSKESLSARFDALAKKLRDEGIGGLKISEDEYKGYVGR